MPEAVAEPHFTEAEAKPELERMSLLAHLEELRKRVIVSLVSVALGFGVAWSFADRVFTLTEQPIKQALASNGLSDKLVYTSPTEPFNVLLKVGLLGGIFLASPFVLYQVWMFISPGLYRHERRYALSFLFFSVGLFLAGGYFGYQYVYPSALDFLIGYGKQFQPMITISEYTNLFLTVILGLGVVFEMPIVIAFLALMRVVTPRFLWNNFRYAVLGIFVVAAILTPTTDILNMTIFAGPMIGLYLLSIGIAWAITRKKSKTA